MTGKITIAKSLDREEKDLHVLLVKATDLGTPPLSNDIYVWITVNDANDLPPVFQDINITAISEVSILLTQYLNNTINNG